MMLLAFFTSSSHTSAYALIDLDPGSSALTEEARGAEGTQSVPSASSDEKTGEGVGVVEVSAKQRGYLLALLPVEFPIKVMARADGRLEVDYPWYSFMTLSHRAELETKLRAAANNAKRSASVGSVRAAGESAEPKFTPAEAEAVAQELTLVLAEHGEN